jgi:hypothetical protein
MGNVQWYGDVGRLMSFYCWNVFLYLWSYRYQSFSKAGQRDKIVLFFLILYRQNYIFQWHVQIIEHSTWQYRDKQIMQCLLKIVHTKSPDDNEVQLWFSDLNASNLRSRLFLQGALQFYGMVELFYLINKHPFDNVIPSIDLQAHGTSHAV